MELPASEIMGWKEYFAIYGFTNERQDIWAARLLQAIVNMSGRSVKKLSALNDFLPPYLQSAPAGEKSIEQQMAEAGAFHSRLTETKRQHD